MQIIPIHYTPSVPVTNWLAIDEQARQMAEFIDAGEYGEFKQGVFALHHSQVSEKPLNFFVLNPEPILNQVTDLGSRYIVNPRIVAHLKGSEMRVPEGCASFPHRAMKNMERAMVVVVEYEIPDPLMANGLKKVSKQVERIVAQIFQHECGHANAQNIFFKAPKNV